MRRRHLMLLAAALVAAATAACGSAQPAASTKTIATVSSTDFRAVLAARKTGDGGAPTARVTLTTYRRTQAGNWQRLAAHRLTGTFFWHTVTGPRAICDFALATAKRARVTVRLLLSPSLGCGKTQTVRLKT